jgi:hypothetical protein
MNYLIHVTPVHPSLCLQYLILLFTFATIIAFILLLLLLFQYYHHYKTVATDKLLRASLFPGAAELTTHLLRLINILWLPLCRINKFWFYFPRRLLRSPILVGHHHSSDIFIALRVLTYIRFIPLPASMNTRPLSYPPICVFNTIGACPGLGTFLGWSSRLNLTVWSDHYRYFVVPGGDDIARFTCLDMFFCSFFFTLGHTGSLRRRTPSIWDSFDHFVLDLPDLRFSCRKLGIQVLFLGSIPWLLVI